MAAGVCEMMACAARELGSAGVGKLGAAPGTRRQGLGRKPPLDVKGDTLKAEASTARWSGWIGVAGVSRCCHSCKRDMREWAEEHGVFVPLDAYYDAITFREPSRPGHELAPSRDAAPLDLSERRMA